MGSTPIWCTFCFVANVSVGDGSVLTVRRDNHQETKARNNKQSEWIQLVPANPSKRHHSGCFFDTTRSIIREEPLITNFENISQITLVVHTRPQRPLFQLLVIVYCQTVGNNNCCVIVSLWSIRFFVHQTKATSSWDKIRGCGWHQHVCGCVLYAQKNKYRISLLTTLFCRQNKKRLVREDKIETTVHETIQELLTDIDGPLPYGYGQFVLWYIMQECCTVWRATRRWRNIHVIIVEWYIWCGSEEYGDEWSCIEHRKVLQNMLY